MGIMPTGKVADAVAEKLSGSEPDPGFLKSLNAIAQYKQYSQVSRYWWMAVMALTAALAGDFLPYDKLVHVGMLAVVLYCAVRAAFRAARASFTARKADAEADRKMKIGIIEDDKQSPAAG